MSANSVKISTLCLLRTGSVFEQLDQALSLSSCFGLNLLSFLQELGDLVEVAERCRRGSPRHCTPRGRGRSTASSISSVTRSSSASSSSSSPQKFAAGAGGHSRSVPRAALFHCSRRFFSAASRCASWHQARSLSSSRRRTARRHGRALEPLEELGADQADDLLLAVLTKGSIVLSVALVVGQGVVDPRENSGFSLWKAFSTMSSSCRRSS